MAYNNSNPNRKHVEFFFWEYPILFAENKQVDKDWVALSTRLTMQPQHPLQSDHPRDLEESYHPLRPCCPCVSYSHIIPYDLSVLSYIKLSQFIGMVQT